MHGNLGGEVVEVLLRGRGEGGEGLLISKSLYGRVLAIFEVGGLDRLNGQTQVCAEYFNLVLWACGSAN